MTIMKIRNSGFTIVELLIVIVVVAVLAAISVVAYNGIQSRAIISKTKSDLAAFQRLLELYKADNGTYPISLSSGTQWDRQTPATKDTFIVGVVPMYTPGLPIVTDGSGQYLYISAGSEYKMIKYRSGGLSATEWNSVPAEMKDHRESMKDRYGVWSAGGGGLG